MTHKALVGVLGTQKAGGNSNSSSYKVITSINFGLASKPITITKYEYSLARIICKFRNI